MAPQVDVLLGERQRLARGHPELLGREVETADHLGHRVFDLEPGVHLEEEELAVLEEELDGAGVDVATGLRHSHRGLAHGLADLVGEGGGRALLDQLLMTTLGGAVSLAHPHAVAVGVGDDLHLDVAGPGQVLLEVDLVTTEVGQGLPLGRLDGLGDAFGVGDHLHAAPATAVGRLDGYGKTVLLGEGVDRRRLRYGLVGPGDALHVRRGGGVTGRDLVAHDLDGLGRRADPGDAVHRADGPREVGVLGEEAVARVDAVGAAPPDRVEDGVGVEVALGRRLTPEREGFVGEADVERVPVELGVDGDRGDAGFLAGTDDPDGDLAPVGDQDLGEHPIGLMECRRATPEPACPRVRNRPSSAPGSRSVGSSRRAPRTTISGLRRLKARPRGPSWWPTTRAPGMAAGAGAGRRLPGRRCCCRSCSGPSSSLMTCTC